MNKYKTPELYIEEFELKDIITVSNGGGIVIDGTGDGEVDFTDIP